ncbi:helix-turn-helix domain-containing protein [Actinomadura litoris]|uniref:helix-turn-helix domain-containing protein n=1 Tax=Actinomadura litoris TaxID=2678616 RepID=UPI001FA7B05B|nr:helix-turn-helix transcriptional regulator [Actinomadura litoris]
MRENCAATAVDQVIAVINERFRERLTVEEMALSVRYSRGHLTREFRRVTGMTPARFLQAVRIREARKLLLTSSLGVREVAARVGYSSAGTFSATFKDTVGLPPSRYRALVLGSGVSPPAGRR